MSKWNLVTIKIHKNKIFDREKLQLVKFFGGLDSLKPLPSLVIFRKLNVDF